MSLVGLGPALLLGTAFYVMEPIPNFQVKYEYVKTNTPAKLQAIPNHPGEFKEAEPAREFYKRTLKEYVEPPVNIASSGINLLLFLVLMFTVNLFYQFTIFSIPLNMLLIDKSLDQCPSPDFVIAWSSACMFVLSALIVNPEYGWLVFWVAISGWLKYLMSR